MTFGIRMWLRSCSNFHYCACEYTNLLKWIVKSKWLDALKHRFKELEGVSDALWQSHDFRVGTLEAKMGA